MKNTPLRRKHAFLWKLAFMAVGLSAPLGCAQPVEPAIASSAPEAMYAAQYPDELTRTMEAITAAEDKTKEAAGKLGGYPDELKNPPWPKVLEVVNLADSSGRAYAYVEARRANDGAKAFYEAEKDELVRRVAGACGFTAKQKGCDVDVSGAAAHALKETFEKRLEKRLREASEANVYIDRNQTALGKDNVDKLHAQADNIAGAAYLAHVVVVEEKVRLRRMLEEAESVKQALDAGVRAEQAYQAESDRTPAEKKASEERAEKMRTAAAKVDSAVQQARSVSERADERVAAVQKAYDDAILKLREDLKKRGAP
ncbi:MAG: hypothetical protein R3B70_35810 [Polyangiaceae bacterium]